MLLSHNHPPADHTGRIRERWSFRRSNYFPFVGDEVKNVTENVGVLDMTAFAKMEVSGHGARDWLDSILANRIPKKQGRIALTHLLTPKGGVKCEFTVYEFAPGRFYLVSAGAFERHDHDVLRKLCPTDGSVQLSTITNRWGVLVLAGPRSREVLQKLTDADLSNEAFPWLSGKVIPVGPAFAHALRVNFVGELGWELHHPIEMQNAIFDLLFEAGEEFGIKPFGIRAMDSMRLEKSYRLIPRELSVEYSALESGLERFVQLNKGDFLGRAGLTEWQRARLRQPVRDDGGARRDALRRARLRGDLEGRRGRRPLHVRRLWLASGQVAGARHGAPGARRARHRARCADPGRLLQGDRRRGVAVRPAQRAAQGLNAAGRPGAGGME